MGVRPAGTRRRGTDVAISLLLRLIAREGAGRAAHLAADLAVPRSTLHRISRRLAASGLLDLTERGRIKLGPLAAALAARRDAAMRAEDARRLIPRPKLLSRAPGPSHAVSRHADTLRLTDGRPHRRAPKYKLGFANAAVDSPWRIAFVHSVEYGAVKYRDLVSGLAVRHAAQQPQRQAQDVAALLDAGVDGLIVSALDAGALGPVLARAERDGTPIVLVDRGLPERVPHASFVTCDDEVIGRTMALWLAEQLGGAGAIVLLSGLAEAEPAQRRLCGARSVFAGFEGIRILAAEWTGWQGAAGRRIMHECLARFGRDIAGVWCDSGLQAVGSLQAFLDVRPRNAPIPPHTGGDLNLAYKLAIRHRVPLAAVDYPPAMGLRAVETLLDVLRGRSVPRRVDIATEVVVTRGHATASVRPDLWAEDHVRWDLPDELILASGLGVSYDPRSFRIRYKGNRYNRSAAVRDGERHGS